MKRSNALPWGAAVLTSVAAWALAARLLGGLTVGSQTSFVIFGCLFLGALVFLVVRRVVHGPDLQRDEWILMRPSADRPAALTVEAVQTALGKYGYTVTIAPPATDIWQQKVTVTATGIGTGELRFELGNAVPPFFGTVEIDDNPKGAYGVLATCFLFELGALIPDVMQKRTYSTLPEESPAALQPLLPDTSAANPPRA